MSTEAKAKNQQYLIAKIPDGFPTPDVWTLQDIPYPTIEDGQVLLKSLYISVDPYLRGRLRSSKVGDPQVSGVVAEVVESKNPEIPVHTIVHGYLPWARYSVSSGKIHKDLRVVDPKLAPISTANGVLGMPGMTSYFGLLDVCELKEGEQVLVSGAAGAVGSLVGQIAKIKKCYVVGVVGSKEKADYVTKTLGFDGAINYKDFPTQEAVSGALKQHFPKGIDVYFDNVGGYVSDAVYDHINNFARIGICGQISEYNSLGKELGPRFLFKLIYKNATIRGFVVSRFADRTKEFAENMGRWVQEGKVRYDETILNGFDQLPTAFIGLFTGANIGKMQVKIDV